MNKTVILLGANSGIGKQVAISLANLGFNLVLLSKNYKKLTSLKKYIKKYNDVNIIIYQIDVCKESDFKKTFLKLKYKINNLRALINCAAILGPGGEIHKIQLKEWNKVLKTNLNGSILSIKYFFPFLKKYKSLVINFSGGGGLNNQEYLDAYSASKAAIVRITENVAIEYKKYGINICAVAPGGVNTNMYQDIKKVGKKKLGERLWKEVTLREKTGGDSISFVIDLINFLCLNKDDSIFSGRTISAKYDDYEAIVKHKNSFTSTDIFKLRRIEPIDRKVNFGKK